MPGSRLWRSLKRIYLLYRIRRAEQELARLREKLLQSRVAICEIDVKAIDSDCGRLYRDLDMRPVPEQ
jgi:hypothetical protein